jgi:hypothetical protein
MIKGAGSWLIRLFKEICVIFAFGGRYRLQIVTKEWIWIWIAIACKSVFNFRKVEG